MTAEDSVDIMQDDNGTTKVENDEPSGIDLADGGGVVKYGDSGVDMDDSVMFYSCNNDSAVYSALGNLGK